MIDPYQDITFNAGFGMKTTLQSVVDAGLLSAPEVRLTFENVNSQAPDVPELAHQGIFSSHGSVCQNGEKISPQFKPYRFYENTVSATGSLCKS